MHFSIDRTVHTTAFDNPVVDHWLSKLDYGCIVYGSARKSYLQMLDPIHNQGLRLCLHLAKSAIISLRQEIIYLVDVVWRNIFNSTLN